MNRETKSAEKGRGGKIMQLEGGDLFYKDEGDRDDPVIVLLHGFSASQRWWDRVAPALERRGLRVIRFDLLGHGRSEKPRDGYAPDEQARRVADALAKLRVRQATVVGHSMGGTVASALVQEKPGLVRRVAVIGTPPRDGFAELSVHRRALDVAGGRPARAPVRPRPGHQGRSRTRRSRRASTCRTRSSKTSTA